MCAPCGSEAVEPLNRKWVFEHRPVMSKRHFDRINGAQAGAGTYRVIQPQIRTRCTPVQVGNGRAKTALKSLVDFPCCGEEGGQRWSLITAAVNPAKLGEAQRERRGRFYLRRPG